MNAKQAQDFADGLEKLSRETGVKLCFWTGDAPWLEDLAAGTPDGLYLIVGDPDSYGFNFDRTDLVTTGLISCRSRMEGSK